MKVDRAIRGLGLSLLIVVVPFAYPAEAQCGKNCEIQKKIHLIQEELKWISEQLQDSSDSGSSASANLVSTSSHLTSTTIATSRTTVHQPTSTTTNTTSISTGFASGNQTSKTSASFSTHLTGPSNFQPPYLPSQLHSTLYSADSHISIPSSSAKARLSPSLASSNLIPTRTATFHNDFVSRPWQTEVSNHPSSSIPGPEPSSIMSDREGYRTVGYFTNWGIYARGYTPDKIPLNKLTHILYAFADNRDDGSLVLTDPWSDTDKHYEGDSWNDTGTNIYGNLKQLNLLKKRNRNLKILLSIGGWTYTNEQKHFDTPASTDAGRKAFADSCVQFVKDYGFDGIDLDWEYPQNGAQGEQLYLLIREIRTALDIYAEQIVHSAYGPSKPHFEISIAAPGGRQYYSNYPLHQIGRVLDFINVMAYDFSGSWDQVSGHLANIFHSNSCAPCTPFNIQTIIDDYTTAGVPPNKLVLGLPLYGRAFTNTDGIGKPFQGVGAPDQEHGSWEGGVWDFKALPRPGASEHVDEESGASFSYDPASRTLISYDTVEIARRKAQYIQQQGLGGAMWWELNGDRSDDQGSLITNVVDVLGGPDYSGLEQRNNWLAYPESKYDNLRAGFPNDA